MLTEMTECGCKIKEEGKAVQSEIKENIQGTNSEGKETETQNNDLEQKEEINKNSKKMRRGSGTSGTTLNVPICES